MRPEAKTLLRKSALALIATLFLLPAGAGAVCPNTTLTDEQTLWNVHNCSPEFHNWFVDYFDLEPPFHWLDWGWPSCDPTQAFPKVWNSAYLLTYGLEDQSLGPWHSNADYYRWAGGSQHDFHYEPKDANDAVATSYAGWFRTNRVEMKCPIFNSYTAGMRAGAMLHEATHIIFAGNIDVWKHQSNPPGSNCGEPCSDDWYFHNLNSYPYGLLAFTRHSMNQIQIEFDCDLAEFGKPWVPLSIKTAARADANSIMTNRIRNPPGWTCGQPRPLIPGSVNPFTYSRARDQYLACWGIAGQISSNCYDISDLNDKQMCYGMSTGTQSPCASMTDRNLQLACYGMSVAPNYPSNCRDIVDAGMRDFCYSVSSWGSSGTCSGVASPSDKALCQALTYRNPSYCNSITNANDKWFCYGTASRTNSYCANIVQ
ncbi:MAG TPA: hypothetical protein VJ725_01370 [Thermoanaerobaculia bacterium]|nr:hypothetical protein [Thermoanaerobaculia bacterium]